MAEDRNVRIAVVGVGSMGAVHARELSLGHIPRASLSAVCDTDPDVLARFLGGRDEIDLITLHDPAGQKARVITHQFLRRKRLDLVQPFFLHAARLAFAHPVTGALIDVSSPLPEDLRAALALAGAE